MDAPPQVATLGDVEYAPEMHRKIVALEEYLRPFQKECDVARRVRLALERRIGELLARTVKAQRPGKKASTRTKLPKGISRAHSSAYQKMAAMDEGDFERELRLLLRCRH